jgi:hypothetical protein
LVSDNFNQLQVDSVTAPNGLICVTYYESDRATAKRRFAVIDSVTGQNVLAPQELTPNAGTILQAVTEETFPSKLLCNHFPVNQWW